MGKILLFKLLLTLFTSLVFDDWLWFLLGTKGGAIRVGGTGGIGGGSDLAVAFVLPSEFDGAVGLSKGLKFLLGIGGGLAGTGGGI